MRIFSILRLNAMVTMAAALLVGSAEAAPSGECDGMQRDLAAAIQRDPAKTLMLIEDALVIQEGCATEIVKTAITASHADAELAEQIVKTAVNVTPKMADAINSAAAAAMPAAAIAAVTPPAGPDVVSGQGDKSVTSVTNGDYTVADTSGAGGGLEGGASSLRGIYFVSSPASAGGPPFNRKTDNIPTSPCGCVP